MFVKVRAYVGNFASKIIIRKQARRISSRKRSFLTAAKPFTDTEKLFAGGATGYLSTETSGFGFTDNGNNKAFCSRVYLFVNS